MEYLKSYEEIRALLGKEEENVRKNSLIYFSKSVW